MFSLKEVYKNREEKTTSICLIGDDSIIIVCIHIMVHMCEDITNSKLYDKLPI